MPVNEDKTTDKAREKAREFDRIADSVFAPIYPLIAERLVALGGLRKGRCLDIGSGGGHVGIAAAAYFEGDIILLDNNPHALALATERLLRHPDRRGRIKTLAADVHAMPLESASIDLVISRGAMWFWDKEKSLREIWRVLAPGGAALIGGGYGSAELKAEIYRKMSELNGEDWSVQRKRTTDNATPEDYAQTLDTLKGEFKTIEYQVIHEDSGDWLMIRKTPGAP
ncbi:MAG: class I SAM-dependent methyltransferase [Treponema sp.]|jgi:ubiquinone/menaquinone biosynthesis C-methylase UbiE|nr:class I SAM-dependent methyltransferase [Treponema sp.]